MSVLPIATNKEAALRQGLTDDLRYGARNNGTIAKRSGSGSTIEPGDLANDGALLVYHNGGGTTPSQGVQGVSQRSGMMGFKNR